MHASAHAISLSEKTRIRRQIDREWSQHLRPSENKVLTFLFSATIEWNKLADRFSVDRIANGFKKLCGTCLSDKTIRRCLDRLEALGVIRRARTPAGYRIGINLDWSPSVPLATPREKPAKALRQELNEEHVTPEQPRLAIPKARREGIGGTGQNDLSRSVKKTEPLLEGHTEQGQTLRLSAKASDDSGLIRKVVRTTEDFLRAGLSRDKAAARNAHKITRATINRAWVTAWRETFPEDALPAFARRDFGQAKLFLRFASGRPGMAPLEVLDFCVREWRLIVSARFAWMTESGAPTLPNTGFMLRFKEQFADAYNDRTRLRSEMTMSGAERRTKRLVHQGMSVEEARAEVAAKDGLATERAKLAKDRADLNAQMAAADRRENERMRAQAVASRTSANKVRANPVAPTCDE